MGVGSAGATVHGPFLQLTRAFGFGAYRTHTRDRFRRMKVVLIYAKSQAIRQLAGELFADRSRTKGELARDEIYPPLGITILAAEIRQLGHEVKLFDDSIHELEDIRRAMTWSDVVGISVLTPNARRGRELGK